MTKINGKFSICMTLLLVIGCARETDIYTLCRNGDVDNLSKLLATSPELINCQLDPKKWTPLHYSICYSQQAVTKYLVSKGANVNLCTASGETGLHFAAFEREVETVQMLLDAGAEVNVKANTEKRETPLDMAIIAGENLTLTRKIPPDTIKNYVPKTIAELRAEDEALQQMIELLKAHGAKRASDMASEQEPKP